MPVNGSHDLLRVRQRAPVRAARRGSVLVLVMTVLGVLFVTGLAFMATMNFDSEMIGFEKQRGRTQPGIEKVMQDVGSIVRETMLPAPGAEMTGDLLGSSTATFAEMPGVHNLFAPIEPYWPPGAMAPTRLFRWFTYASALNLPTFMGPATPDVEINTALPNGSQPDLLPYYVFLDTDGNNVVNQFQTPLVYVDADGDGIVDSVQVELVDKASDPPDPTKLVIDSAQLAALKKMVNPPSNPNGKVFMGLRVVAHGGMVNVSHSQEWLIRKGLILGDPADFTLPQDIPGWTPYDPANEEPMLRRRNGIPPRIIPPSRIQGNPLDPDLAGNAEWGNAFFPPGQSLREHRYWPYAPDEKDPNVDPLIPLWVARMDAERGIDDLANNNDVQYDRRHLATTISYDDLLRRPTYVAREVPDGLGGTKLAHTEVLDLMIEANRRFLDQSSPGWDAGTPASPDCAQIQATDVLLPFEYAAYPHGKTHRDPYNRAEDPNDGGEFDDWCKCMGDPACTPNPLKGKLRLSLPWLDEALTNGTISAAKRIRIIQNAFTVMLLNARVKEWGAYQKHTSGTGPPTWYWKHAGVCANTGSTCATDNDCIFGAQCIDYGYAVSLTAASLTANLIDFMDFGNVPTEVELLSSDVYDLNAFGRPLGQFVYGLEKQPFITEVVAYATPDDIVNGSAPVINTSDGIPDGEYFLGVELFNPYDVALNLNNGFNDRYLLRTNKGTFPLPLNEIIDAKEFIGFYGSSDGSITPLTTDPPGAPAPDNEVYIGLRFDQNARIQLIREIPVGAGTVEIIVDEVDLTDPANLADGHNGTPDKVGTWDGEFRSCARVAFDVEPWLWQTPVPIDFDDDYAYPDPGDTTFGRNSEGRTDSIVTIMPVHVLLANTGTMRLAFPTTGSLLLLMRHANSRATPGALPFTAYLDDELKVYRLIPPDNLTQTPAQIVEGPSDSREQIDNGRMPVFDADYAHRLHPGIKNPQALDPGAVLTLGANDPDPRLTKYDPGVPESGIGDLRHLPWGQLVFDYFTALPLDNKGPYDADGDRNLPKVDLGGLRVHGRANINVAPWHMLAGLTYVPMELIPADFRDTFRDRLYPTQPPLDEEAGLIDDGLAMEIVAYREGRQIQANVFGLTFETGHYGDGEDSNNNGFLDPDEDIDNDGILDVGWRGRNGSRSNARRGTGFMSVGELANVIHDDADDFARMDTGVLKPGAINPNYLDAIAALASLSDWVTVRSQVFTVYGLLRGEEDEALVPPAKIAAVPNMVIKYMAADVDSRAIRFQATVDRLPTVMGEAAPTRVGKQTVVSYNEYRGD